MKPTTDSLLRGLASLTTRLSLVKGLICAVLFLLSALPHPRSANVFAQEPELKKAKKLEALILANPKDKQVSKSLDELSKIYFTQHQYAPLIDFLRKLEKTKTPVCEAPIGYYLGLCRYYQLKHWEETQDWKEYFDLGNRYREEVFSETEKVSESCPFSSLGVKAQLINWLSHKAQNDAQAAGALAKLMDMVNVYAKKDAEPEIIKEIADSLAKHEEIGFAKAAYNLYVNRFLETEKSPLKLRSAAEEALKERNVDLAEIIYERYIEMIRASLSKDTLALELIAVIRNFASDGWVKGNDPYYAEKVFGALQEFCGRGYFSEELQYLRAYNLQRLKEYLRCVEEYTILVTDFPKGNYLDEAEFKLGIFYAYRLGQKEKGMSRWQKIIERNSSWEYASESLYHKSVLSHYAQDFAAAKEGYGKILALVSEKSDSKNLRERVALRQREINEARPIEYNLKTFLDASLGQSRLSQAGTELLVRPYKAVSFKQEEIKFASQQFQIETGCLVPELTYLWSGDLGSITPVPAAAEFTTDYQVPGTKVVHLVVLSASGVIGSALEMVEVYNQKDKI